MSFFHHLKGDGLRSRALRSTIIVLGATSVQQMLRLASNLILTRLLFPEAFGLMALIQTFIIGLQMFSDIGLTASLIQNRRADEPAFLNTAWTLLILRGMILWLGTCLLAPPLAAFYDEPQILALLPVVGLNVLISGFGSTKMPMADRHLVMGRKTLISIACQFLGLVAMVGLAWIWPSVWALVWGGLLGTIALVVCGHLFMPGVSNRLHWDRDAVRDLINFGKFIFVSTLAGFFVNQGDKIALGRLVSLTDLGIYNIGYFLAAFPVMLGSILAERILFPLYRQIRPADGPESRRKIGRARNLLTGAMVAMAVGLALMGEVLVDWLYDPRYAAAGPILIVLALIQILPALTVGNVQLLLAEGNSRNFSRLVLVESVLYFLYLFAAFWFFGLFGVLLVRGLTVMSIYPLQQYYLRPYKGTDLPRDAAFALVGLAVALLVIWLHWEVLRDFVLHSRALSPASTGNWDPVQVFGG